MSNEISLLFLNFPNQNQVKEQLILAENARVNYYIQNYPSYMAKGYSLSLPKLILENINAKDKALSLVETSVLKTINKRYLDYEKESKLYQNEWFELLDNNVFEIAREIVGSLSTVSRTLVPTFWGTGGSNWKIKSFFPYIPKDKAIDLFREGVIFVKMDSRTKTDPMRRKKLIVHELIAHGTTEKLRENTPIDESFNCTHQADKEWLVGEVEAQILWRMGCYPKLEDPQRQKISLQAQDSTRKAFYVDPFAPPDKLELKYPGNITKVIEETIQYLK